MMYNITHISPVAIDLGGKNTGAFLAHYESGTDPSHGDLKACVLVMPEGASKMTYSQSGRTVTRHQLRNNKRRKLVKRLLRLIIIEGLKLSPNKHQLEKLNGYLNRRGYSRVVSEIDLNELVTCPPDYFSDIWPEYFTTIEPLYEQFDRLQQDTEKLRTLANLDLFKGGKQKFKLEFSKEWDKSEKEIIVSAYTVIVEATNKVLEELDYGHRHRKDYIEAIREDIKMDKCVLELIEGELTADQLCNLLAHISNFQLRTLRWYFNDKDMQKGDRWDSKRLLNVFKRWITGWHPSSDEKQQRIKLLKEIDKTDDVIELCKNTDPELSIPPYEDQNNRRPPKDQTLWLNPSTLKEQYPKWKTWVNNLEKYNQDIANGLNNQLLKKDGKQLADRKSRPEHDDRKASYFLQRLLDRNSFLDNYALRLLVTGTESQKTERYTKELKTQLGQQHYPDFLQMAKQYYTEVEQAKQGIWIDDDKKLLEISNLNPPHKKHILHLLVGNVLGIELDEVAFAKFKDECWKAKVSGNTQLKGICRFVEETRKKWGNPFNEKLNRIRYRIEELGQDPKKELDKDETEIWQAFKKTEKATKAIATYFEHNDNQKDHYNNPYSLAQLYTLIETDRQGFSKTTLAAHFENSWRMKKMDVDGKMLAHCSRLPADPVRPFDGVLRRILERQAWEISKIKCKQILEHLDENSTIYIPILVEENRFSFSIGLGELKRSSKKKKILNDLLHQQKKDWEEKDQRIINASKGLCPYTGAKITSKGEIDHIIPRAYSSRSSDTIYNSESNLIYCSIDGNQKKKEQRYTINDLAKNYLKAQFGTDNKEDITKKIESTLDKMSDQVSFPDLTADQQRDIRHALFLDSDSHAFKKAFDLLATQQKARVNGTQAWLVKKIMQNIKQLLQESMCVKNSTYNMTAARISALDVSRIRRQLGNNYPEIAKKERQPVSSHAVDALCVMAAACDNDKIAKILKLPWSGLSEDTNWLRKMLPNSIKVPSIERKAKYQKRQIQGQTLFKDTIYAENFLPIWLVQSELFVGFDVEKNRVKIETSDSEKWLELLMKFLQYKKQPLNKPVIDWLQLSKQKDIYFTIDKNIAFAHLHKVAKQESQKNELLQADILDALRYLTLKQDIESLLYNDKKKQFKKASEIINDENFNINIKINLSREDKKALGKLSGTVQLPSIASWQSLLDDQELKEKLGTKLGTEEKVDPNFWKQLSKRHFSDTCNNKRQHLKTRRVYSLPTIPKPAGERFRVRRTEPMTNSPIYQLIPAEGSLSRGFEKNSTGINFEKIIPSIHFRNSGNVSGLGQRFQDIKNVNVVEFHEWRNLKPVNGVLIAMCPGSKSRAYIRLKMKFEALKCWLDKSMKDSPKTHYDLPYEIKLDKEDKKKFCEAHGIELLGKPRSNLFVTNTGQNVEFWYIVSGTNTAMKHAYKEGDPIDI